MSYDVQQLKPYRLFPTDFIPVYPWNKLLKGKPMGKNPLHDNWPTRLYKSNTHKEWIEKGYNLGYRISDKQLVIDIDPRNYDEFDDENSGERLARVLGAMGLDDLLFETPCVRTPGGGYHIYYNLPDGTKYTNLRETLEAFPGIEFKRKGRQVVAAGSKHPNGGVYAWETYPEGNGLPTLPANIVELIKRDKPKHKGEYSSGKGALNGMQLKLMVLDKLEVGDYNSYDSWFPIMAACHHATDGEGIDQFVNWSLGDETYKGEEHVIRNQWEKLWEKENVITIGTLIQKLDQQGDDSTQVKAALDFKNNVDSGEFADDEETEEAKVLLDAEMVASQIDLGDFVKDPELSGKAEGKALRFARALKITASEDDIMKVMRLIKIAGPIEAEQATKAVVDARVLNRTSIGKILKQLDNQMSEDLAAMLNKKTLDIVFNAGKHLLCRPNGSLYMYNKTHWKPISNEFLMKITRKTLTILREKLDIVAPELSLIEQAAKLSKIDSSTITDRIYDVTRPLLSVINCKNGELWMEGDGSHKLKPHTYKSYQTTCLNVEYDPSAECPLFMDTLRGIFKLYPDGEDIIRHMGEIMGYSMQPLKNIASWWLFRGPGGDGKSTILKVINGILGESMYMSNVRLLSSLTSTGNNHAFNSLVNRLLVVIEEIPMRFMIKDEMVKLLSENTKMEANPKIKDPFDFIYCGSLIMCSNGYPRTNDLSQGMFRRANVIPFNRQFDKNNIADRNRAENILNNKVEMSGVLNFMLEGLQRLRDRGEWLVPPSCDDAKRVWLGEANTVYKFVDEKIERTNGSDCVGTYGELYDIVYQLWCQENGIEESLRKKKINFRKELENLGFIIKVGGQNVLKVYGGKLIEESLDEYFDDL